jgi:hypothetical protein
MASAVPMSSSRAECTIVAMGFPNLPQIVSHCIEMRFRAMRVPIVPDSFFRPGGAERAETRVAPKWRITRLNGAKSRCPLKKSRQIKGNQPPRREIFFLSLVRLSRISGASGLFELRPSARAKKANSHCSHAVARCQGC